MELTIKDNVLKKCKSNDENIIIPEGVKKIGEYAFFGCENLTSITIPDSVTSIGEYAFYNCSSLTSITIPDSVTSIGEYAFYNCSSLTSITIPNSVKKIEKNAFNNCRSLTTITIPNSVKSIEESVFEDCSNLTSITIPNNVISIGYGAFSNCKSLTSITIPDSVAIIWDWVFSNCKSLTSITIPDDVISIGYGAFSNCKSLTSITIPDSVKKIGKSAFYNCSSLTSITIPDSVVSIGIHAFKNCINLTSITIPDSITSIEEETFFGCGLTSITIPDSVKKIGKSAFYDCSNLTSITIPDSVTSIGEYAFYDCSNLTSITIPNTIKDLGRSVFSGCESLISITIPDSVVSIGIHAFKNCINLTSITIPDSVTSIEKDAFLDCDKLEKINISNLASWIEIDFDYSVFDPFKHGAKLYINNEEINVDGNLTVPEGTTKIVSFAFGWYSNLTSITIPDSVTSIGDGAFCCCSSLTSITIPDSVTSIGKDAFFGCDKLNSVSVPSTLKKIGTVKLHNDSIKLLSTLQMSVESCVNLKDLNPKLDVPLYPLCKLNDAIITQEDKKEYLPTILKKLNKDSKYYIPYAAFADDETVCKLIKNIPIWLKGQKKEKEIALRVKGGLLLNDSLEAMKYAEKINMLERYASIHDKDVETLRDELLANFGLDQNGCISWDVGEHVITAKLQNDLKFILTDENGKNLKSISKYKEANKAFSDLKKKVKSAAKIRNEVLLRDFLSGKTTEVASWSKVWLNNPLLKILGRLIVWSQDNNTFTLHEDGLLYKSDNSIYSLTDKPICVAHPMEMNIVDLEAWRKYFSDNNLKQPFEQVWEPVLTSVSKDRYKNCTIALYHLMNKEKHGIVMEGQSELRLTDCEASIAIVKKSSDWINNLFEIKSFNFDKYTRSVNHIVSILDKGTVESRIKNDDISIELLLDRFTLAQIMNFINIAIDNKCNNALAVLMEYKETHFSDFNPLDEFTLDL